MKTLKEILENQEMIPALSFKRDARMTGLAGMGYPNPDVHIKANGKKVGYIAAPAWNTEPGYKVRLHIKKDENYTDNNPNTDWKTVRLKGSHETEEDAREYVKKHWENIHKTFKLHSLND